MTERAPIVAAVEAAIEKKKDPKKPQKLLRITRAQHHAFVSALDGKQQEKLQQPIPTPEGLLYPSSPGQWNGMRFVVVDGENDVEVTK